MTVNQSTEDFVSQVLHSLIFFEEFAFAKSRFSPPGETERELADALVLLDDVLLVVQIKERSEPDVVDSESEQKWFDKKVVRAATKQIRDTMSYLESNESILIYNERGRQFDIASSRSREVIKLVIHRASPKLPSADKNKKHHMSDSVGFIHIFGAEDYLEMARVLRVPEDVIRYLRYRETMIDKYGHACRDLPEASMVGGYVGDGDDQPPVFDSYQNLHQMIDDEQSWDIASYLRTLRDHTSDPEYDDDYYTIFREFVRLPRSFWREFKTRLLKCIENVNADKFELPYRIAEPSRSLGIVFFSADSSFTRRPEWNTAKTKGLINFTELHKFDQKLQKCIGVQVAKEGSYFDIQWCLIDRPWEDDSDLRQRLDNNFPFRAVHDAEVFSYFLQPR